MNTVFSGSIPLTNSVTIIVSIDGGVLLAGAVTVVMLFDVWIRVRVSVTGAADVVISEPPSTSTTEYATRLWTVCRVGDAWGFSGKAKDIKFKEQSAHMNRRDVRHITETRERESVGNHTEQRVEALKNRDAFETPRVEIVQYANINVVGGRTRDREPKHKHLSD